MQTDIRQRGPWLAVVVVAGLLAGCGGSESSPTAGTAKVASSAATTSTTAATTTTLAAATAMGAPQPPGAVVVTMANFSFMPDTITVKAGDVAFFLANREAASVGPYVGLHDLTIPGPTVNGLPTATLASSSDFRPGESGTFTVKGLAAGTYPFYCSVHRSAMTGTLVVTS